jgi:hypothetical protein
MSTLIRMSTLIKTSGIMLAGVLVCAQAQWLHYPTPGTPRTRDGKANLSAPTPRASNGKPDLSGVWQVEPVPAEIERLLGKGIDFAAVPGDDPRTFSKYFFNILADFKSDEEPMKAEAAEFFRKHTKDFVKANTETYCLPMGIPRAELLSVPFKIIQTPGLILMIYEADGMHRQVYTDGRKLPVDMEPAWLGYSTGKWDAATLVVDTAGFNDRSPLDRAGHPRSEETRMIERFRRRDFGHMEVQITIDDPQNYTKPFTIKFNLRLLPDTDVLEKVCAENERDLRHLGLQ